MINMNKTPEPGEKSFCKKMYKMAGLKTMNMKKDVALALKKLIDDRRKVLKILYIIVNDGEQRNIDTPLKNLAKKILEKIDWKTWEELNDKHE